MALRYKLNLTTDEGELLAEWPIYETDAEVPEDEFLATSVENIIGPYRSDYLAIEVTEEIKKGERNRKPLKYFAYACNPKGKIEQLLVERIDGKQISQTWTGKLYKDENEADEDMIHLNCNSAEGGRGNGN